MQTRRLFGLPLLEWLAFVAYCSVLVFVVPFHEPWADEAQAWLIGRSLPFHEIVHELGYEGTPPLWSFLLRAAYRLHLPYLGMRWLSASIAAAGVFVLLRYSPLPRYLKLVLPFTFWIQYQYAVVCRNYVLFVAMLFVVSACYQDRWTHFLRYCLAIAILVQVSSHALLFGGALSLVLAWELWRNRAEIPVPRRLLSAGFSILLVALGFAVYVTWTPGDAASTALSSDRFTHLPAVVRVAIYALRGFRAFSFGFSLWPILAAVGLILLAALLLLRRRYLLLLPFLGVWVIEGFHWQAWHAGLLFVSYVAVLWMALSDNKSKTDHNPLKQKTELATVLLLLVASLLQLPWTWHAVRADRSAVYCPSQQVADFLRTQQGKRIYGFRYQSVAILPYFDRNIFANQPSAAFWHWGKSNNTDDPARIYSAPPDMAVIGWSREQRVSDEKVPPSEVEKALTAQQYRVTHRFCGSMYMRDSSTLRPCFFIYEQARM